ncbi:hormone-sensitive lipase-like isoform X1 [Branchiostoma floridae]|uniref:Hormone-sensitive lipase n=1 Tax=Branchiostoma floridae TaxID=7739 RepID=A0A9J7LVY0_BRAFL|nr:hormone-sensitive lipase-like isoform X1 [Branchiostoma floridae]
MAAVKADSTTEEKAAAPESKPAAESVRPKEHGHRDKRKKADVVDSAYNCWFKTLRSLTANNSEYFERHKTQYSSRFSSAVCILQGHADAIQPILEGFIRIAPDFDVDESTPSNGYRSLVKVVGTCIRRIIHVQRKVVNNRDGLLFQSKHYCQELEAYASVLCQLRAIMDVAQKVLAKSKHGQLFPEEKLFPEFLFEEAESLDKECFYGRCVGFQFCSSMQPIFHTISTAMASFAEAYSDHDGQLTRALASLLNSGKYAMNPELRARTIVSMCDKADISFCKAFWNITEEGPLQHMSGFLSSSVNVNKVFHIPAMPFEMESSLEDGELVTITPPCSQTGPGPVQVRLICFENREGQPDDLDLIEQLEEYLGTKKKPEDISSPIMDQVEEKLGTKKKVPAPKSDALIIHIHGGGFVAQSSKSHEMYLRTWAKDIDVPILSVDYSLAPAHPFPRAMEECFFAYAWALKNAHILGTTAERVCLAGDSAGGNLCVSVAMRAANYGIRVPDGVLAAYTPFLVRYTPSPSRLLCMMDPLLPMGILSRCIAAYAGLKEKKPGEDVSSSSSTTSSTPQLSTPEHNFSSARLVFDPSPTEPKRSGEGAAAPKLLFTNTSGGLCEVHTPSPSPPGGDGPVQTDIPVLTVETETAVIQGKLNTEPTVDNLKEPHFEDIALSPYEEDSGDSEWSLTDKQTEVDSPSGVSDEKSPEEGSEGKEKDRAAEDDPNRPSSLSLPSLPSLDEISMAISKMTESKPEEVVLPSEPVHSPTSISHVTRYRPSPILNNPYMSPLLADDELLKGLPPVYLVPCALDPVLDDSIMFAHRLKALGIPYKLQVVEELSHGFLNFTSICKEARQANDLCINNLLEMLGRRPRGGRVATPTRKL